MKTYSSLESDIINSIQDGQDAVRGLFSTNKTLLFNGLVVTAYGRFEKTIKDLSKTYIKFLIKTKAVESKDVKKEQLTSIIKTIERADENEQIQIVNGLYDLYINGNLNSYNSDVSLFCYQNLKTNEIKKIAHLLGINDCLDLIVKNNFYLDAYYRSKKLNNIGEAIKALKPKRNKFEEVDEVVDYKNSIAHEGGYNLPIASLANFFETHVSLLLGFVLAFSDIIKGKIVRTVLRRPTKVNVCSVRYNKAIEFNTKNRRISSDDYYIVVDNGSQYSVLEIVKINENNRIVLKSKTNSLVICELFTPFKLKKNHKYLLVKKESVCVL